jgi:HAD superfamily hydrolase (TIGR01509 family)
MSPAGSRAEPWLPQALGFGLRGRYRPIMDALTPSARPALSDGALVLARPAALLLDMDGLLIDTERLYLEVNVLAAAELGYALAPETNLGMVGVAIDGCRRLLAEAHGAAFPFERFRDLGYELLEARMADGVPVKPGAVELVAWAKGEGVPVAVATSTRRERARHHLERVDLLHRLDALVTRDDVVAAKPAPEPYLTAAGLLGVAPGAALALEDSANGVRSAAAAGVPVVMVPDVLAPTEELRGLALGVVPDLHAVLAALRGG